MRRLILLFLLVPSILFGAFTEFYCVSGGSNLNGGSDTSTTATYTSTNGNWSNATNQFTPTDGTNPVSSGVTVGQFASIYVDGATVGVFIARITAVTNASNGPITVHASARAGTQPSTSVTARTIKVGGAWQGPNGAILFPFSSTNLSNLGNATDASADRVRLNLKNNQTYTVSSNITANSNAACTIQGYTSTPGDLGKATIDGSTNNIAVLTSTSSDAVWVDLIFHSASTTGGHECMSIASGAGQALLRCIANNGHGSGFWFTINVTAIECEAYGNNRSNTAGLAGFQTVDGTFVRCYSHDNTGNNTDGFINASASATTGLWMNCIADSNGRKGFNLGLGVVNCSVTVVNSDSYNNGSDGIFISNNSGQGFVHVEGSNLIKNGGFGINSNASYVTVDNCGYGSGSQVNTSGDSTGTVVETSKVVYAAGAVPWVSPGTGDFRINLAAANWAGRGTFTETGNSKTGTVGFPDIGAAQSKTGPGGTFSKEVSGGFSN